STGAELAPAAMLRSRSDDKAGVGVRPQSVSPGDRLARGLNVGGNLQEEMLTRTVGLRRRIDHLDGGPGIESQPGPAPENPRLVFGNPNRAAERHIALRRHDLDHD